MSKKSKSNIQRTEATNEPSEQEQAPFEASLEASQEVAAVDPEVTTAPAYTGPIPEYPVGLRALEEIADELAEQKGKQDALEAEKASVMKDYSQRIGVLDARVSELAANYREAKEPVSWDYEGGWKHIFDGHTQRYLRTEHIPAVKQTAIPKTEETISNGEAIVVIEPEQITIEQITIEQLTVGTRVCLDRADGPYVAVKAIVGEGSDASILIEYEGDADHDKGTQEQVGIERFAGGTIMMTRSEPTEKKKNKKSRRSYA